MSRIVFGALFVIGVIGPVLAQSTQQPTQQWSALDRITLVSTGSLTIAGDQMTFGTDGSIHVRLVAQHARGHWSETNETRAADIYKVDPPAKPTSAAGSDVLCDKAATYIVLSHPVPGNLDMSVYTGASQPKGDGHDVPCATFSYTEG